MFHVIQHLQLTDQDTVQCKIYTDMKFYICIQFIIARFKCHHDRRATLRSWLNNIISIPLKKNNKKPSNIED